MKMKNALWNSLSFLAFVGIIGVVVIFSIIFLNPYSQVNPLPPPTMPVALFLPSNTPTQPRLPATWTPEEDDQQVVLPELLPSSTVQPADTQQFIIPTRTPSPAITKTYTSSPTVRLYITTVSGGGSSASRTPTPSRTATRNLTATALSRFATQVRQTQIASGVYATQTVQALPPNPASASEFNGALTDTWQNDISEPVFTWPFPSSATGYYVYFGTNQNGTNDGLLVNIPVYTPPPVTASGTYYLRLRTRFIWAARVDWSTVFIFRYDINAPVSPSEAEVSPDVDSGVWQNDVSDPQFTWDDAQDNHSGMSGGDAGYDVYFGPPLTPTPDVTPTPEAPEFVDEPEYEPGEVTSGKYDLIIRSYDAVGNVSGWSKIFEFWYDGINPDMPANLTTADPATDTTPTFTWDAAADEHSGLAAYEIYWGTDAACGMKNQPDTTSTSFTAPEISTSGVPYLLCVWARDRAGNLSDWAQQTTFTYTP